MREPASSRLQVPEPVLFNRQQVLESADESLHSNDGQYEGNDGQSEESEESEENELGQHGDDMDHLSAWGAQRPIGSEFLSSQRAILAITPGNNQNSSRRIRYPGWRTSAQVRVTRGGEQLRKYELAKVVVHLPFPPVRPLTSIHLQCR